MPIKDSFSYDARWNSVGLDCQHCRHFQGPENWPDKEGASFCKLHNKSLMIELNSNGYKEFEWFCKDFDDNGSAYSKALQHFYEIRKGLSPGVLYRLYGKDGNLVEYRMKDLNNST